MIRFGGSGDGFGPLDFGHHRHSPRIHHMGGGGGGGSEI
eukprot:CAMPEP_0175086008 /NCGR_PEP_ID=MMETSP0052_2-20121109/28997_1 /TAXON_ID=51329 ORGANISM="Polytomella parva, Strain SAG 63-3" /NCGR_SAMPLE_ID=MMETSP0052_2 /ASSEMBLY_ACC=CAM_ASM_000194 /LENGTH=38 /DNA_ID= /DNA_START= /DNA_END= /DNA_ORIENTATION=